MRPGADLPASLSYRRRNCSIAWAPANKLGAAWEETKFRSLSEPALLEQSRRLDTPALREGLS
jgi:hypothetical protein